MEKSEAAKRSYHEGTKGTKGGRRIVFTAKTQRKGKRNPLTLLGEEETARDGAAT